MADSASDRSISGNPAKPGAGLPNERRRKWKRRALLATLALLVVAALHAPLLRAAAGVLILDESGSPARTVLILDGDRCFDVAAQRVANGAEQVLMVRRFPSRLERMGIIPSAEELGRRELRKRRVAETVPALLSDDLAASTTIPSQLCDWARRHPEIEIDVLCDRFSTRKWDLKIRRVADGRLRKQIRLIGLRHRNYDESNWWRSKQGIMAVLNGFLSLGYQYRNDGRAQPWRERTEAEFEAAFMPGPRP